MLRQTVWQMAVRGIFISRFAKKAVTNGPSVAEANFFVDAWFFAISSLMPT
jgi:hypothetical protein